MSALGQKRTFSPSITMSAKCHLRTYRQVRAMSALSLKADIQTPNRMSAKCQKRTWLSGGWRTLVGGADLGFPGNFNITRDPLGRFDRATLNIKGNAQLDYQQIIIQSGIAYEVARWQSAPGSFTALDLMGSARYWNQDVDLSLRLTGTLTVDLRELGLQLQRSRRVAIARSGDLDVFECDGHLSRLRRIAGGSAT
jgi:hypothetical protein